MRNINRSLGIAPLTIEAKARVEAVLARALEDIAFRELLTVNPVLALEDSGLTVDEIKVVSTMRRVALEEWGIDVRKYRTFLLDNGFKIILMQKVA